jgi:hypothetical protein
LPRKPIWFVLWAPILVATFLASAWSIASDYWMFSHLLGG